MFQLTVNLNDDLREFIAERTKAHGLESADDFIEFMLRMEILRLKRDEVEKLIQEGLDSGDPIPVTPQFWAHLRAELEADLDTAKPA